MIGRVGFIGVGHLAGYLVEGLRRASPGLPVLLSPRNVERSASLAARFGATVLPTNQEVADASDMVWIATRPGDTVAVCQQVAFRPSQIVISTAVGVPLEKLRPAVEPATALRALPISCAAISRSPTLLHPDHEGARELLTMLGTVYVLPDEAQFTPASVISGFYGWIYALLDVAEGWLLEAGLPQALARNLVLETVSGAAGMGLDRPDLPLLAMLEELSTPGGITRQGLEYIEDQQGLSAWREALARVDLRLRSDRRRP